MKRLPELSEALQPMFDYEISRGNTVGRIDKPAGSNCPLAIIFLLPIDVDGFISSNGLPKDVRTWENRDRHYPLEKGFVCERTRHAIAGPLLAARED